MDDFVKRSLHTLPGVFNISNPASTQCAWNKVKGTKKERKRKKKKVQLLCDYRLSGQWYPPPNALVK